MMTAKGGHQDDDDGVIFVVIVVIRILKSLRKKDELGDGMGL